MKCLEVVTLLPEMIEQAFNHSIIYRAQIRDLVRIRIVNLRNYAQDRHHTTDDTPCGGGGGMILKVEPIAKALDDLKSEEPKPFVILTDPQGEIFTQAKARELAHMERIIIICGHYEGVDERVKTHLADQCLSIGDYVLTGGELPALVIADALIRLQSGVLGDEGAPGKDSFAEELLEYPHYTKPRLFREWEVPEILFSGHHARIQRWRRWHQLQKTRRLRPDLWRRFIPTAEDLKLLDMREDEI
jgi:tRNA (guanine37-N1)-methyltransferase